MPCPYLARRPPSADGDLAPRGDGPEAVEAGEREPVAVGDELRRLSPGERARRLGIAERPPEAAREVRQDRRREDGELARRRQLEPEAVPELLHPVRQLR